MCLPWKIPTTDSPIVDKIAFIIFLFILLIGFMQLPRMGYSGENLPLPWIPIWAMVFIDVLGSSIEALQWHNHRSLLFSCQVMSDACDLMDCSTPGFPVLHYLLEFAQTHVHWVGDAIQPSHPLSSPCLHSFPGSGSFPMSLLFASGGHSLEASASALVLPMNTQRGSPLGLTGLISVFEQMHGLG